MITVIGADEDGITRSDLFQVSGRR